MVELSSAEAGQSSALEFVIDFTQKDYQLVENKEVLIQFPAEFSVNRQISRDEVTINDWEPEDIHVVGNTVSLTIPDECDGDSRLYIRFAKSAGLKNPPAAGSYQLTVTPYLKRVDERDGEEQTFYLRLPFTQSIEIAGNGNSPASPPIQPQDNADQDRAQVLIQIGNRSGTQIRSVDGQVQTQVFSLEAAPYLRNSTTWVPLRFVAEGLGVRVAYDEQTRQATLQTASGTISFTAGSRMARVNGSVAELSSAVEVKNGRMMVPLRFITDKLEATLEWEPQTQTITITQKQ
ncbi:hypothetical protein GCM10023228_10710 [Brevibacillus fulvus]